MYCTGCVYLELLHPVKGVVHVYNWDEETLSQNVDNSTLHTYNTQWVLHITKCPLLKKQPTIYVGQCQLCSAKTCTHMRLPTRGHIYIYILCIVHVYQDLYWFIRDNWTAATFVEIRVCKLSAYMAAPLQASDNIECDVSKELKVIEWFFQYSCKIQKIIDFGQVAFDVCIWVN